MKINNFNYNWPLIGNNHITEFLGKIIANRRINGTYIFNGPDNLGKTTLAKYFAQSLLCDNYKGSQGNLPCGSCQSCVHFQKRSTKGAQQDEENTAHGDYHVVKRDKDKKNITIEQIRNFNKILSLTSFSNTYKIGVIKHADSLSKEAANALLKTLEEPRDKVIIILVTHNIELLPTTIKSRCQILNFHPVQSEKIYDYLIKQYGISRAVANSYSRLCLGRPALALKFFENKDFAEQYLDRVKIFLNFFQQDINQRIQIIDNIFGPKKNNENQAQIAKRVIEIWQGIIRDWLLLDFGCNDLIQHQVQEELLFKLKNKINTKQALKLFNVIRRGEENIMNNVNPRLALINIALAIE